MRVILRTIAGEMGADYETVHIIETLRSRNTLGYMPSVMLN